MEFIFGSVELQQSVVFDGNRMGYKTRAVTRDRDGIVTNIGDWQPPSFWLVFQEPAHRPWWTRVFGAS